MERQARTRALALIACVVVATTLVAQAQSDPAIPAPRPLGAVVARSTLTFQSVARALAVRGAVYVNDASARQIWRLDSALAGPRIVLDSVSGNGSDRWYGSLAVSDGLRRFRGDSVLFQSERPGIGPARDGLILGPDGGVARIVLVPQREFVGCLVGDMDRTGWMRCDSPADPKRSRPIVAGDSVVTSVQSDSTLLMAVSFATWDVDTIGRVASAPRRTVTIDHPARGAARTIELWPMVPLVDAWAIFNDGTLAIAHATDYHVETITPQRAVTHGARVRFDWRRLTDGDRRALQDSARRVDPTRQFLSTDEWPSHWPPFKASGTRTAMTDEDDRLWIDERQPAGGDTISVYGIFDRNGQFLERVKIPASQTIVGFAPGGNVYMTVREGSRTVLLLARFK